MNYLTPTGQHFEVEPCQSHQPPFFVTPTYKVSSIGIWNSLTSHVVGETRCDLRVVITVARRIMPLFSFLHDSTLM